MAQDPFPKDKDGNFVADVQSMQNYVNRIKSRSKVWTAPEKRYVVHLVGFFNCFFEIGKSQRREYHHGTTRPLTFLQNQHKCIEVWIESDATFTF